MTPPTDDLNAIAASIWAGLARACDAPGSPWQTPVVGTADGNLRTLVLRRVDAGIGQLLFFTDARSPKATLIGEDAPVSLLFYDPVALIQLRCAGSARIDAQGAAADAAWAASTAANRRAYLARYAPGTRVDTPTSGLPDWAEGRVPTFDESEGGRANFAALTVNLTRIDYLYLGRAGHRRATFERDATAIWSASWLVP